MDAQNVARVLRSLELLSVEPVTPRHLATALAVHPRTARRMLDQLAAAGYAAPSRSKGRGEYVATLKVVTLVGRVIRGFDLVAVARSEVVRLSEVTGETAHLGVPASFGVVQLIAETSKRAVAVRQVAGEYDAYHSTALGKALLAHDPARLAEVLEGGVKALTRHTVIDPADLLVELAEVRKRGFAIEDRENYIDVRSVAAPIIDHSAATCAAIGISAPVSRVSRDELDVVARAVVEASAAISEKLGFA